MRFLQNCLDWLVRGRSPKSLYEQAWATSQERGGIPLTHTRQRWWFAQERSHPSNICSTPIQPCIRTKLQVKPEQIVDKARSHLGQASRGERPLDGATHAWCRNRGHPPGSAGHWARHLHNLFPLHRPTQGNWNYFEEGLKHLHFMKVLRTQSLAHAWWESFNLGEMLVSPVRPIAKRSAWGSDVFSLCTGSEAMPCWCWKRRRCWQGRALRELCYGQSSHGGSLADHLYPIIWAQPAEMASSACFCTGGCIVSIKWDCGRKRLPLFASTDQPKALCHDTYRAKKCDYITATYRAKKSVRIESFGQGTMKTRLYLLENMNAR